MAALRCILKLADRIDHSDESVDDGAFEDCEIDSDDLETTS